MSKRAEQKALEAYPVHRIHRGLDADNEIYDSNAELREGCIRGYEQAEKDINKEMMDRMAQVKEAQEANVDYGISFKESELPIDELLYLKGRKDAEKDLALTWEDMERIHTFLYAIKNNKSGAFTFTRLSNEQYEETLKRFNEWREKK